LTNEKQGKEIEIKPVEWWWMKQANDDEWRSMQVLDYGWIGFDFRVKVCEKKKSVWDLCCIVVVTEKERSWVVGCG